MDRPVKRQKKDAVMTASMQPPDQDLLAQSAGIAVPKSPNLSHEASRTSDNAMARHPLSAELLVTATSTFQPGRSRLESIPCELLLMGLKELASDASDITDISAYRAYSGALHSLCLVSRIMAERARPELYRDVRLYCHQSVIHLLATFCKTPTLASHVKSILFCPPDEAYIHNERPMDIRPLRSFPDPHYDFWIRPKTTNDGRMPNTSREELVCNLFAKALFMIPSLEFLYFRLPNIRVSPAKSESVKHLSNDTEFMQQLGLQTELLRQFRQGLLLPDLSNLRTVGMLELEPTQTGRGLLEKLFSSPKLSKVLCVCLRDRWHHYTVWDSTLGDKDALTDGSKSSITVLSTNVKKMELRQVSVKSEEVSTLTQVFPSLESLTLGSSYIYDVRRTYPIGRHIFQKLAGFHYLHTLEVDCPTQGFTVPIKLQAERSTLVQVSGLSKLHTLLLPVDFFVRSWSTGHRQLSRAPTVVDLPDSLCRLTMLLNQSCSDRLVQKHRIRNTRVGRWIKGLLREIAQDLIDRLPRLQKVDLCYDMEEYRQRKVETLAARLPADGRANQ